MHIKQILVYCFILYTTNTLSQINTKPLIPGDFKELSLRKESADSLTRLYINRLIILDSRSDTTNIGYSPVRPVKQYNFKKGFINELSAWLNSYLNIRPGNSYGHTLLINIKKLRVSDDAVSKLVANDKVGQPGNGWLRGVITKIEYFIQEDSFFIPLYRFDSILPFKGHPDKDAPDYFSITLKLSLEKLFKIDPSKDLRYKRHILLTDIIKANKLAYYIPVYNNNDLKKGVYRTFEDFKMNKICYPDFELKTAPKSDILYVKENGNEFPVRSVWGYCDGLNFYINSGDIYSKLIPTGHTFYFNGIKSLSNYTIIQPNALLIAPGLLLPVPLISERHIRDEKILKYYQLDMENGNIY